MDTCFQGLCLKFTKGIDEKGGVKSKKKQNKVSDWLKKVRTQNCFT